jgi:hypothetical protein
VGGSIRQFDGEARSMKIRYTNYASEALSFSMINSIDSASELEKGMVKE